MELQNNGEITLYEIKNPYLYFAKNTIFHPGKFFLGSYAVKKFFKSKFFSRAFFAIGTISLARNLYFQNHMISEIRISKSSKDFIKIKYGLWGDDWMSASVPDFTSLKGKMKDRFEYFSEKKECLKEKKEKLRENKDKLKEKLKIGKKDEGEVQTSFENNSTEKKLDGFENQEFKEETVFDEGKEEGDKKEEGGFGRMRCYWRKK